MQDSSTPITECGKLMSFEALLRTESVRRTSLHESSGLKATMERFIHRENLRYYRKQLAITKSVIVRQQLVRLRAEEEERDI